MRGEDDRENCDDRGEPGDLRLPGGQEVVVLPPLLRPLLHRGRLLRPLHPSLRGRVLQESGGLHPVGGEEAGGGGEEAPSPGGRAGGEGEV